MRLPGAARRRRGIARVPSIAVAAATAAAAAPAAATATVPAAAGAPFALATRRAPATLVVDDGSDGGRAVRGGGGQRVVLQVRERAGGVQVLAGFPNPTRCYMCDLLWWCMLRARAEHLFIRRHVFPDAFRPEMHLLQPYLLKNAAIISTFLAGSAFPRSWPMALWSLLLLSGG